MVPSTYSSAVLANNPTAYYRLDETAGPTLTNSAATGSAENGTYYANGVTYGTPGALYADTDTAVALNGLTPGNTAGYAQLPSTLFGYPTSGTTTAYSASFETWFKANPVVFPGSFGNAFSAYDLSLPSSWTNGTVFTWTNVPLGVTDAFTLGSPNVSDVINATGQVITLPTALQQAYTGIDFLAFATGNVGNVNFTVTWSNGTTTVTQPYTQAFASWTTGYTQNQTTTGVTSSSTTVTGLNTSGFYGGMAISGVGIPAGTTVASVTNSTTIVLSKAFTGTTNASTVLTFNPGENLAATSYLDFNGGAGNAGSRLRAYSINNSTDLNFVNPGAGYHIQSITLPSNSSLYIPAVNLVNGTTSTPLDLTHTGAAGTTNSFNKVGIVTDAVSFVGGVILGQIGKGGNVTPGNAGNPSGGWVPALYVDTSGNLRGSFFNGPTQVVSPNGVDDGNWHQVVLTYTNDLETLYLDGVAIGSNTGPQKGYDAGGYDYFLGAGYALNWAATNIIPFNNWSFFRGSLDEAAVYPTALTAAQVQTHYLTGIGHLSNLSVTETSNVSTQNAGGAVQYTIIVTDNNTAATQNGVESGITVNDPFPVALYSADTWTVTYSAGSSGPASGSGDINATINLAPGGTATFIVNATLSASAPTPTTNTATVTAPGMAPTDLVATPSYTQVFLSWNAPTLDPAGTTYDVYCGSVSGGETLLAAGLTMTNYLDTGLTGGSTYYYYVTAVYPGFGGYQTPPSNEVSEIPVGGALVAGLNTYYYNAEPQNGGNQNYGQDTLYHWKPADLVQTVIEPYVNDTNFTSTTNWQVNGGSPSNPNYVPTAITSTQGGANSFSIRWTGLLLVPTTGSYQFATASDDGSYLFVNGSLVVNNGRYQGVTTRYGANSIYLQAGQYVPIEMDYYQGGGGATAELEWITPGASAATIIPASQLFSAPLPTSAAASATYVATDTTTHGNWMGTYGAGGYDIQVSNSFSYANGVLDYFTNNNFNGWGPALGNSINNPTAALQVPDSSFRLADCWFTTGGSGTKFQIYLNFADQSVNQVALYAMDWDNGGRSETIQVVDPSTGAVLDTRSIAAGAAFHTGEYLVWNITGHVEFVVTCNGGPNGVISGIFIGGGTAPLWSPQAVRASAAVTVAYPTAVSVTKTATNANVYAGNSLTYAIAVQNTGANPAYDLVVTDPLPAGFTTTTAGVTYPSGWTAALGTAGGIQTVTFTDGDSNPLAANGTANFSIVASVAPSAMAGTVTNTASASGLNVTTTTGNVSTTVGIETDLAISKTPTTQNAVPGQTASFTVTLANNGPSDGTGIALADPVPSDVTAVSWAITGTTGTVTGVTTGGGAYLSGTGAINLGGIGMSVGSSITISETDTIDPAATGSFANTVTVTPGSGATDPDPNTATATVTLTPQAALAVTKSVTAANVYAGNTLTYDLGISNSGPSDAHNVVLTDPLPAGLTTNLASDTIPLGWTATLTTTGNVQTVTLTDSDLAVGGSASFTIVAQIPSGMASGTMLNNTASASATDAASVSSATATTTVQAQAILTVSKTAPATVHAGDQLSYTVTVTNTGPSDAQNVVLNDPLPAGTTFVSDTQNSGLTFTPSESGNTIHDTIAVLPAGQSATFTWVVQVPANTPSGTALSNTVTATGFSGPAQLAYWALDDGSGTTAVDSSGNGNTGTLQGSPLPTWGTTSPVSGDPGDIVLPGPAAQSAINYGTQPDLNFAAGQDFTITGWFNTTASYGAILSQRSSTSGNPVIDIMVGYDGLSNNAGHLMALVRNDDGSGLTDVVSSGAVNDGNWHRFAVVRSGNTWTLYLDGASQASRGTVSGSITTNLRYLGDEQRWVQDNFTTAGRIYLAGSLDDVAVFDQALTAAQIGALQTIVNNTPTVTSTADTTVDTLALLNVTKSATTGSVYAGNNLTYNLSVTNTGPSDAQSVTLSDPLPAGTTLVSIGALPGGWVRTDTTPFGSTGTITFADTNPLTENVPADFSIVVNVSSNTPHGTLNNTVTAGTSTLDTGSTLSAAVATTVNTYAVLTVTKSAPATVDAGTQLTYTVTLANSGPSDAQNVVLTDPLPSGTWGNVTFASVAYPAGWSETDPGPGNPGTVTFSNPDLAPTGTPLTFTITVNVPPSVPNATVLSNTATATFDNPLTTGPGSLDVNTGGGAAGPFVADTDYSGGSIYSTGAAIDTSQVNNPAPQAVYQTERFGNVTYTIPNLTPGAGYDVRLDFAEIYWTSAGQRLFNVSINGQQVLTNFDIFAAAGGKDIAIAEDFTAMANNFGQIVIAFTTVRDNAKISGIEITPLPAATADTTVQAVTDLSISKTPTTQNAVPGQTASFTIQVSNSGPSDGTGIAIADGPNPAADVTAISWQVTGTTGTVTGLPVGVQSGPINLTNIAMSAGSTITIAETDTIDPAATGSFTNTATVTPGSSDTDPDTSNNSSTATVTLTPTTDLVISKTPTTQNAVPGQTASFTIQVSNSGPSDGTGIAIADGPNPAADVTAISWQVTGTTGTVTGLPVGVQSGPINLTNIAMSAGSTITIAETDTIDPSVAGSFTNTATVTPGSGQADPDTTNNTSTATVSLTPQAVLTVTKTAPASVYAGNQLTYNLSVTNTGPSDAQNVVLTDPLPAGTTFVSVGPLPSGWTEADPGVGKPGTVTFTDTNHLTENMPANFRIVVQVGSAVASGTGLSNTATVSTSTSSTGSTLTATANTTVNTLANLTVTKSGPTAVVNGNTFTYTLTLANTGPSNAANLTLTDPLPTYAVFVSEAGPAGWAVTAPAVGSSGIISFRNASFAPGTAVFTIVVRANAPTLSPTTLLANTATATAGDALSPVASNTVSTAVAATPNALYVYNVYEKLLNRTPDPGATYWVQQLDGGLAPPAFVLAVEQSPEYLTDVVASLYQHYLHRAADSAAAFWVSALAAGTSVEQVAAAIVSSPEYYADHGGTSAGFVEGLYQDILGRAADPAGLAAWAAQLGQPRLGDGSSVAGQLRDRMAMAFLTSTEYRTDLVNGGPWVPYNPLTNWGGYYPEFLQRAADPAGQSAWVNALALGLSDQTVLAAIFGSAEAYGKWS